MFRELPKELNSHVFSFLYAKDLFNVSLVNKENKALALQIFQWRRQMITKFHCLVPEGECVWDLYLKLKKERDQFIKKMQEPWITMNICDQFNIESDRCTNEFYQAIFYALLENNHEKLGNLLNKQTKAILRDFLPSLALCDLSCTLKTIYTLYGTDFPDVHEIKRVAAFAGSFSVIRDFFPTILFDDLLGIIFNHIDGAYQFSKIELAKVSLEYRETKADFDLGQLHANSKKYKEIIQYLLENGVNPDNVRISYVFDHDSNITIPEFCNRYSNQVSDSVRQIFEVINDWVLHRQSEYPSTSIKYNY